MMRNSSLQNLSPLGLAVLLLAFAVWGPQTLGEPPANTLPPALSECPDPKNLLLEDGRPGLTCCPNQPYVLCSQSSCTILAGVAVCECEYMGNEVSLASPYSSFNDLDQPDGKKGLAPWTNTKVENVCQYMEDLTKVNKVLSTYNPKNYNYQYTGSYVCPDAEKMIWAQCDGAVCEVVDEQGKPKPFHEWTPGDPSICTCQAVQSPALMPGPISADGKPDPEFAQKYCGKKPNLDSIDYPETGVHIALDASAKLLETPVYDYLFEFYAGHTFKATPKETQELTPFP